MSKTLIISREIKNNKSYISIWNWIQRFGSSNSTRGKRLTAFIIEIDETVIQIGIITLFLVMDCNLINT